MRTLADLRKESMLVFCYFYRTTKLLNIVAHMVVQQIMTDRHVA